MTLETFKKACERMKENNEVELIAQTKFNLEKKPDEERRKIFNEIFAEDNEERRKIFNEIFAEDKKGKDKKGKK